MILSFVFFYQPNDVAFEETQVSLSETEKVLFFGTGSGLTELDPQNIWDSGSIDVVTQVVEGLFKHDLSDPDLPIISHLAADHGTWDGNRYTVILRENIFFQDGTPFNASCVEFTFDRLAYLMDQGDAVAADIYRYYDHATDQMENLIIDVNAISEYVVEFELAIPYGLFESILCFVASSILPIKPTFDLITDSSDLVGTGPFTIEYVDPGNEIGFRPSDNYWQGHVDLDRLVFKIIPDIYDRVDALMNSEIHMMTGVPSDYIDTFNADPNFVADSKDVTTVYYYGMNNNWISKEVREAISYVIDYDYIINELLGGQASRLRSPVPEGIIFSDDSFNVAETDVIHARTVMQNLGYGVGFDLYDEAGWEASTFLSFNFSYILGSVMSENSFSLFQDNLGKIGIEVTDAGMDYAEFFNRYSESAGLHREMLQLFWFGWGADYNDPSNFINNLFTNRTVAFNGINYNGFQAAIDSGRNPFNLWDNVQLLMEAAIFEIDPIIREQYYYRIQQILVEEDRPWVFGYVPIATVAYKSEIQGFQWNAMQILEFFGVTGVPYEEPEPEPPTILILGSHRGLVTLDPLNALGYGSLDVIDQVAEGLFWYDLSDPDCAIIPKLAEDHGTWDGNFYTVDLVQNAVFHDGYPFNASAVEFWFKRLQYFLDNDMVDASSLYQYYDPETDQMIPIINDVEILSEYSVRFHLAIPYAPFEALLAFESSFIISPESHEHELEEYIDINTDTLVGTGPFVYEYYDPDVEVSFRAFENYWDGEPSIDFLKFRYIYDQNERADLLASGDIHMALSPPRDRRGEFEGNPDYTLDSVESVTEYYLGMSNYWINRDLREAISYAIDYDYMMNELPDYDVSRLKSPIPNGILYSDDSFNVPALDIILARTMMQSMGYGVGFDLYDDAAWESSTFLSLNYTYNFGNQIREDLFYLLEDNLSKIGIEVLDAGMDGLDYFFRLIEQDGLHREMLQLFFMGWGADYNDPSNFIDNMFTNRTTAFNTVNYNGFEAAVEAERDPFDLWDNVQLLMEAAILEIDPIIRAQYYYRIQQLLVEEDMPCAYGFVPIREVWYDSEIQGFQWNSLEKLDFHEVSGVLYEELEPEPSNVLILGSNRVLQAIDPLDVWDHGSWDVIDQVAEGLFGYDHSHPDNIIIPKLAADHGTWDGNLYTVELEQNVVFHDGYPFNASAVEFWFDRLQHFKVNGMLRTSGLYEYYDHETDQMKPIINDVEVLGEYTVGFHLNVPYGPFESLLAFESSFILSPESTPLETYIDTFTETLVGTGPFVYEYYDPDVEVRFRAFENYWDGELSIDFLKFRYIEDANERADLLASGDIHMILNPPRDRRGEFEGNPDFTLDSVDGASENYLGMNIDWIPKYLREAISYAIDYDYMINELIDYDVSRLKSPIPNGILYSVESFDVATYNLIHARIIMQSNGLGVGLDLYDNAAWESSTFLSVNYTYNIGSPIRESFYPFLVDNLGKIGILVIDDGISWPEYLYRLIEANDRLQLFLMGWGADYNDPSNFIDSQFTNRTSAFNTVDYNGFYAAIEAGRDPFYLWDNVQLLMEAAMFETDQILRAQYYARIQQLLIEEDIPWIYAYTYIREIWYDSEIQGFQWNALERLNFVEVSGIADTTPPESYAWEEGIKNLDLEFYGDVTINIDAWDDKSGVAVTYYSFDNIEWYTGDTFVISDLGTTDYYYYSVDNAGNEEAVQSGSVTITSRPEDDRTVIYGLAYDPFEIDPLRAYSMATYAIIDQVAEGLFAYDLSDDQMAIVPRLALGYGVWSPDGLSYTVNLRSDVYFHDGEHFDARAVKWTFDRMIYFMELGLGYNDYVYRFVDGTPIISSVDILDTYMVQFTLNRPFAGFEALLSFTGSAILSSKSTPATAFLDPSVDVLVGTGPFKLDRYVQDVGVGFVAFQDYYDGEARIKDLWYLFIDDTMLRTEALMNGYIDFLDNPDYSMLPDFETNPDFTVLNTPSAQVNYLSMNNHKVDRVFRQAIAYAFDYDFIISMYPDAIRAESIIAEGLLYSDWSDHAMFGHPTFDIVAARQILLYNGFGGGLDPYDDAAWTDLVDFGTPIATFNFTYNIGNLVREDVYYMLRDNLRLIGIELIEVALEWSDFIERFLFSPERIELMYLGWIPDFNDPFAMIDPLFTPGSIYNIGLVDEPYLQNLMDQGRTELIPGDRQGIYGELQRYCMEYLIPVLPILNPMHYLVHDSIFQGFYLNALEKVWFHSVFIDTISPSWEPEPTAQSIELGDHLSYQVSATDNSEIDHYWVSDTDNFAVDSNGIITTTTLLEVGVYELEVRAYDPYSNYCTVTILVTVQDTTAPFYDPVYDTLPAEIIIIYTRSTQLIGSLLVQDRSEISFVVLQHNNPSGGPDGFVVETYPEQEDLGYYYSNIVVKTTSSLEIGRHELTLYIYDAHGNVVSKDFVVLVYRQFDLKLSGEFDYLEEEEVRISISAYLIDAETGEYIDPADYVALNLVVGFDLYDPDGIIVKTGYLTYEGSGVWRWVDTDTIRNQEDVLVKGVYMVDGWVDVDHDYILEDRDVIQIHIDPPASGGLDPMVILMLISFSGLIALIAGKSIFYIRKRKRKS